MVKHYPSKIIVNLSLCWGFTTQSTQLDQVLEVVNQYCAHSFARNCPSWISGKERMTIENISWSISMKECCRPRGAGRGWGRVGEPATSWSPVGRASNWATEANQGRFISFHRLWRTWHYPFFPFLIIWTFWLLCNLNCSPIRKTLNWSRLISRSLLPSLTEIDFRVPIFKYFVLVSNRQKVCR